MKTTIRGLRHAAATGAVTGAVLLGLAGSAFAQTNVTVAVPNPSAITWAPMWAAIGEGYFEEEGLVLDVQAVDGSSSVLQAMASGQAEIGAPGPGPVLGARARGLDVKFIYNLYPKSVFGLLVPSESDYEVPADLAGQVIGVGTADGAEVSFAESIMNGADMSRPDDFTFLPVGDGGTAAVAFLRDDVAAYVGAVSDAAILASRGIDLREITPDEYLGFFGNGYAALESYIAENPEVIEGFGRALVRGMEFMSEPANKETALDHMAVGNPSEGEDRDFAAALFDAALERMTPTDAYIDEGFGFQPQEHWEAIHQGLVDSGALEEPVEDLQTVYTNEFVPVWNGQ